ncbi:hypothetical protein CYMTET_38190 [Cymbomonas tetramitiformis]|uniref:Uncharacterized protein n=1 Tax=Cymbomonas tetramitiformis TaxID=36881 RepID=A0AAE0F568_9CHLO|nr:hypothetical protein CYMTET_38190 [Cymbomonas tetramitiformis]
MADALQLEVRFHADLALEKTVEAEGLRRVQREKEAEYKYSLGGLQKQISEGKAEYIQLEQEMAAVQHTSRERWKIIGAQEEQLSRAHEQISRLNSEVAALNEIKFNLETEVVSLSKRASNAEGNWQYEQAATKSLRSTLALKSASMDSGPCIPTQQMEGDDAQRCINCARLEQELRAVETVDAQEIQRLWGLVEKYRSRAEGDAIEETGTKELGESKEHRHLRPAHSEEYAAARKRPKKGMQVAPNVGKITIIES